MIMEKASGWESVDMDSLPGVSHWPRGSILTSVYSLGFGELDPDLFKKGSFLTLCLYNWAPI